MLTILLIAGLVAAAPYTAQARTSSTVAQAKREIARLWRGQAQRAFCIVNRESSWNPHAVSQTNDHGLFQINGIHERGFGKARWARRYDPVENVRMAWALYRDAGWQPWAGGAYPC